MQTPQVLRGVAGAGALDRDRGSPQRLQSVVGADALDQARVELEQKCDLCGASSEDDTKLTNFWWRGYSRCQQCQSSGEGAEMTASPHSAVSEAPKQARRAAQEWTAQAAAKRRASLELLAQYGCMWREFLEDWCGGGVKEVLVECQGLAQRKDLNGRLGTLVSVDDVGVGQRCTVRVWGARVGGAYQKGGEQVRVRPANLGLHTLDFGDDVKLGEAELAGLGWQEAAHREDGSAEAVKREAFEGQAGDQGAGEGAFAFPPGSAR